MKIENAIKLSINNVIKEGLTDIFERPFEVDLLKNKEFAKKVGTDVEKCIKSGDVTQFSVNNIEYILLPKNSAFNFRKCALIHPLDTVKYTALVILIAKTIENSRIPISKKKIFSYRFYPKDGYLFNKKYNITEFKKEASIKAKSSRIKFVVSCDIANFYDRLNLHRLENILYSIGCDKKIVKMLNGLLLTWTNRDSYGLPVGSNASRILAEASLIGVDDFLVSMKVDFIRFVDDYRIFAPDAKTAHYWLTILIERLHQEGLSVNMSKTKIEESFKYVKEEIGSIKKPLEKENVKGDANKRMVIRAGYGGTVPTKFRKLSKRESNSLSNVDKNELLTQLKETEMIDPENFIRYVKTCFATEEYDDIELLIYVLDKYLQLTPYFVDAIIKCSYKLSEKSKKSIKIYFGGVLNEKKYTSEYLILAYIRLFGTDEFADRDILLSYFRNLKRQGGMYIGRTLLDAFYEQLIELADRNIALEIKTAFSRADLWEKRQIVRIMKKVLHEEELRPWLKNIKQTEVKELFLQEIISPAKKYK